MLRRGTDDDARPSSSSSARTCAGAGRCSVSSCVLFGGTVGVAFVYLWLTVAGRRSGSPSSPDGPAGRRLAVKDLFDTAGIRTTYGSAVFADHVPP